MNAVKRIKKRQRASQQSSTPLHDPQVEQELMRLEREWLEALKRRDPSVLDSIQADEFIYMVGEGKFGNKADARAALSEFFLDSISSEMVTTRVYGDLAVVALRGTMKGTFRGEDFSGDYLETAVWCNRDGRWQVVAAHLTRMRKK
jgi:hypothetical protein